LTSGAAVSAHIATMPCATPGFRLEIYGRDGALTVSTSGAPQRDPNRLMGSKGKAPMAPIETPAHYIEVPADTPAGPPNNVAHLYRRLAKGIADGGAVAPDFDHALKRHRLIDTIARSSSEGRSLRVS
jgi:predicted dehydrogenase